MSDVGNRVGDSKPHALKNEKTLNPKTLNFNPNTLPGCGFSAVAMAVQLRCEGDRQALQPSKPGFQNVASNEGPKLCMYTYTYMSIWRMYVCTYVCMYVCMYVCNVCICMHAFTRACVCMYVGRSAGQQAGMQVCIYVCMYVCMYVCVCMYAYTCACMHIYIRVNVNVDVDEYEF